MKNEIIDNAKIEQMQLYKLRHQGQKYIINLKIKVFQFSEYILQQAKG